MNGFGRVVIKMTGKHPIGTVLIDIRKKELMRAYLPGTCRIAIRAEMDSYVRPEDLICITPPHDGRVFHAGKFIMQLKMLIPKQMEIGS